MNNLDNKKTELSKLKREYPFGVPDNYFDDFSSRLQIKLEAEKKAIPKKENRIIQFLKPAIGLAAGFAIIILLVNWPLKSHLPEQVVNNNNAETEFNNEEYLSLVESIDENSFYALLDEPATSVEFSDEDLMNYVSANISEYEIYLGTDF
ncbi:MAG: hypothetical protein HN778_04180 [Prolixibacteraceae bacterium]|jgi:hypothetical protein|nr:hypothetical protein [Prolixibacteraceae bacterium]MBT6764781.1 hypothetical protein [Prolixibacteraceae bacterium]MBT7000960.1 hypothetical protein [Prolixibacteraceae bacterium]MBT7394013.1 hypothetical protein [Prolixibacteraceae bacterium]